MVEIEGKIVQTSISVLIDLGSRSSYISPSVIEKWKLNKEKHKRSWLIQLATDTKRKVIELVRNCKIEMNGMISQT